MTITPGNIAIIADDLTGANDTALQFMLHGGNTQILLNYNNPPQGCNNTQVWSINTESRHISSEAAYKVIMNAVVKIKTSLNIKYLYKKIDSTLRGNIATEALAILEAFDGDAVIIVPAFPEAGRTTVGGYHLLAGNPIERTEVARDPRAPISQSHIPTLLAEELDSSELIGQIGLGTVMRGAAPILSEFKRLIEIGKKLIVVDAVSVTDLEQIALAIQKGNSIHTLIPCGSAGLGKVVAKTWLHEFEKKYTDIETEIRNDLPAFAVIGSDTQLTRTQIDQVRESHLNVKIIDLTKEQVLQEVKEDLIQEILFHLSNRVPVILYSSPQRESFSETLNYAKTLDIEINTVPTKVSNFLAQVAKRIVDTTDVNLLLAGGETANKCCSAINSLHLQVIAAADFAIPLCLDQNAQWIITKSGNIGYPDTLLKLLKFLGTVEYDT